MRVPAVSSPALLIYRRLLQSPRQRRVTTPPSPRWIPRLAAWYVSPVSLHVTHHSLVPSSRQLGQLPSPQSLTQPPSLPPQQGPPQPGLHPVGGMVAPGMQPPPPPPSSLSQQQQQPPVPFCPPGSFPDEFDPAMAPPELKKEVSHGGVGGVDVDADADVCRARIGSQCLVSMLRSGGWM